MRSRNGTLSDEIDTVSAQCISIDTECMRALYQANSPDAPSKATLESPSESSGSQRVRIQFPQMAHDQVLAKMEHRLLSAICAHSSSLAEMMTTRCEVEMERTRKLDGMTEESNKSSQARRKQGREIGELQRQLMEIRKEYDDQIVDDFNVLTELALTVEGLEAELASERRGQRHSERRTVKRSINSSKSVIIPIRESTVQIQERVAGLTEELATKEEYYKSEIAKLQNWLGQVKSRKIRSKSQFQQNLKSVFKDFQFMSQKIERAEASLEKANLHYQLDEEEMLQVVSPIIDSIDFVRGRINQLTEEAETMLYSENAN